MRRRDTPVAVRAALARSRFVLLLICLLGLFVFQPMLPPSSYGRVRVDLDVALAAVLLAGIWSVSHRWLFVAGGALLVVPVLLASWYLHSAPARWLAVTGLACAAAFMTVTAAAILRSVVRARAVTADTIVGGICVYFLLALVWALVYALLERLHPGSFGSAGAHAPIPRSADALLPPDLLYFSVLTLTTMGSESVSPLTAAAQAWAGLEAIVAQLYLAVFIARLVGLHASRRST